MTLPPRAPTHDRLAELVVVLSGVHHDEARQAIAAAIGRHGDAGDNLINVADALMALRDPTTENEEGGGGAGEGGETQPTPAHIPAR